MSIPTMNELIEVAQESKFYDVATWDKDFFESRPKRNFLEGKKKGDPEAREVKCIICGKILMSSKYRDNKYCSHTCSSKGQAIVRREKNPIFYLEIELMLRYCEESMYAICKLFDCSVNKIYGIKREMKKAGKKVMENKTKRGRK